MKIAILGYDIEGKASFDYFARQGHELTICDQSPDVEAPADAASVLGDNYLDNLNRFDLVVRTAGLPPRKILEKNPGLSLDKITTHINEFFKASPTANIIGITGTKGKGTASTLIARMLQAAGRDVQLGGNIGVPPLSLLGELTPDSWVVLELSSFQLIDLRYSPPIAVCLMVVPEHLDWHADVEEYYRAKSNLFAHQTKNDKAIYFAENETSKQITNSSTGRKIPYFAEPGAVIRNDAVCIGGDEICKTSELKLLGPHNWQNVCAAVTAVRQVSQNTDTMRLVLTTFTGLRHRLELVREVDGVRYYDDSFGTTPETAIVAIQAFSKPKVVILGGSDKGADYAELAKAVANANVRCAVLIGDQAERIRAALERAGFTHTVPGGQTMQEIVAAAKQAAQSGDVALLSPACASFDMFKNYQDRGEQFTSAVQALAAAAQ